MSRDSSGAGAERVLRVSELGALLRSSVESATRGQWVVGEAGKVVRSPSGHVYFTLKDDKIEAAIDCVVYRREAMRFERMIREGSLLELRGVASFYAPRGRLQWIVSEAREAGLGEHLARLRRLQEKLRAEGLFDQERKRPLPPSPRVVGVVTSRSGAAFHDIVSVVRRRAKVRLVLSSALVQGSEAVPSILAAIDRIEKLPGLDVLIVGRGGGSKEDLMVWNDEAVVRRLARTKVPVVSAVGHEIDTSLSDLVADVRAATPSQAAELVTPDESARAVQLGRQLARLAQATASALVRRRMELGRLRRKLGEPRVALGQARQSLDEVRGALEDAMKTRIVRLEKRERALHERLLRLHPRAVLLASRARLGPLEVRLGASMRKSTTRRAHHLAEWVARLDALSPLKVLGRGYSVTLDEKGRAITSAISVKVGEEIVVRLHEGRLAATVTDVKEEEAASARKPSLADGEGPGSIRS